MNLKKHVATRYTLEDGENTFPLPFEVSEYPDPLVHVFPDGLAAVVACLARDDCPQDPFEEYDEGQFYQFDRCHVHYTARPEPETMLAIIRDNPGRVFYICTAGDGYALNSSTPLRLRDALNVDDRGIAGYYITPEDATDPASYAKGALESYSAWCTGDVYGVMAWRYTRPTQLSPWELDEESRDSELWGLYGYDYAKSELRALFEAATETEKLPPGTPDPRD